MTGPKGSSEFCFPETLNSSRGEAGGNIEVEGKKLEKTTKKSFALYQLGHKFAAVSRSSSTA